MAYQLWHILWGRFGIGSYTQWTQLNQHFQKYGLQELTPLQTPPLEVRPRLGRELFSELLRQPLKPQSEPQVIQHHLCISYGQL